MSSHRSDTERAVWTAMRELVLERGERRPEVAQALGLSFVRVKVLRLLLGGGLPQQQITAHLQTDRPYTSVVVGALEADGYVTRTADPGDARRRIVTLTPKGRRSARRATAILERPPTWLARLDGGDLAELARLLDQGLSSEASQRL